MTKLKRVRFSKTTKFGGKIQSILISKIYLEKRAKDPFLRKIESPIFYKNKIKRGHRIAPPTLQLINKKYRIVDGNHRIRALKRLGYKKLKAEIV